MVKCRLCPFRKCLWKTRYGSNNNEMKFSNYVIWGLQFWIYIIKNLKMLMKNTMWF